jgi:hypothetical protein
LTPNAPTVLSALPHAAAILKLRKSGPPAVWEPRPGGQTMLRDTPADWTFYGGQAGGGKTFGTLGLAATEHRNSVIFRREFTDLKGAEGLIEKSREMLSAYGAYNANDHVWRIVTDGARRTIEFAGIKSEADKYAQQGRARDLYVFDEAPQFTRAQVRYVTGWLRSSLEGQRKRVVLTGNPPTTAEGLWIVTAFAPWLDPTHPRPAQPGEIRWFVALDEEDHEVDGPEPREIDGEMRTPHSRTYIPSILAENPTYALGSYAKTLDAMPEPFRSQLKHGDFSIGLKDDAFQVIPTDWIRAAQKRWTPERPLMLVDGKEVPVPQTQVGVDVARGGDDDTTVVRRFCSYVAMPEKLSGVETDTGQKAAAKIAEVLVDGGFANVDVIGVGASAYDSARGMKLAVMPINFGAGCDRKDQSGTLSFANMRAYAYWRMREVLDPNAAEPVALPPHPEVLGDLASPRFSVKVSGIQIEAKDDIKKRIGRSPDVGDAIVLSFLDGGASLTQWRVMMGGWRENKAAAGRKAAQEKTA